MKSKKLTYVEPKGYISKSMQKILDEGAKKPVKQAPKSTAKKTK